MEAAAAMAEIEGLPAAAAPLDLAAPGRVVEVNLLGRVSPLE